MKVERFNPYMNYEDKHRADNYIMGILNGADLFEYRTGMKPTVFMSNDVLHIIALFHREKVISKNCGESLSICGYDVKMVYGEKTLYLGIPIFSESIERSE